MENQFIILALLMLNIGITFSIVIIVVQLKSDLNHLRRQFSSLANDFKDFRKKFIT